MPTEAEYGSWTSPITVESLTEGARGFLDLQLDQKDSGAIIYWAEVRPSEKGRSVVCSCSAHAENSVQQWTPPDFNARTKVHEYGGGGFLVYDSTVYFSNFTDQRLYQQKSPNAVPEAITPADKGWRYADGCFANGGIYCIREDHSDIGKNGKREPETTIVFIAIASKEQFVVVSGVDFYSCPRISAGGRKLAWMEWDHPNMPWDSTRIMVAQLDSNGLVEKSTICKVAHTADVAYMQPCFFGNGELSFISDETNYWNLCLYGSTGTKNVCPKGMDLGEPHWVFGNHAYCHDPANTGNVALAFSEELGLANISTGAYNVVDTGYAGHSRIRFAVDGQLYCLASSPKKFAAIIRYDLAKKQTHIVRASTDAKVDQGYVSVPEHITFPTGPVGGTLEAEAHAYFYAPQNKDFAAPAGTRPPLIVLAHGGPTGHALASLSLKRLYYTSRGFALLDVNYRGSTGYGRRYRNLLRYNWGIFDVEDCCNGALFLAKQGKVDARKLCITGGSAGGFSVLACLTFADVFQAGASHFGVSNLTALAEETHKFESRYLDSMLGPWPQAKQIYVERSPITSADKLSCPVIFFQGLDDKVVLPNQAEMMYKVLLDKKLPTALIMFEGEGHGFVKAGNVQLSIDGERYFFCRVLGIPTKEIVSDSHLKIENLPIENRL